MIRFGILLVGGVLAHDHAIDRPATYAHRSSALRAARRLPAWMIVEPALSVTRVDVYEADDPSNPVKNGKPSFVVERT